MSFEKDHWTLNLLFLVAEQSVLWYRWPLQHVLVQVASRERLWIYERESAWTVVWLWSLLSLLGLVVNMYNLLADQTDFCCQGGITETPRRMQTQSNIKHALFSESCILTSWITVVKFSFMGNIAVLLSIYWLGFNSGQTLLNCIWISSLSRPSASDSRILMCMDL